MIKKCNVCKENKDESKFSRKGDGLAGYCKDCHKKYCKNHYNNNKSLYYKRNKIRILKLKSFIESCKVGKKCLDCDISYPPYVMDFDHLKDKKYNIAEMYQKGLGVEKIKEEIEKCELVCSNCHRIRTHKRNSKVV